MNDIFKISAKRRDEAAMNGDCSHGFEHLSIVRLWISDY